MAASHQELHGVWRHRGQRGRFSFECGRGNGQADGYSGRGYVHSPVYKFRLHHRNVQRTPNNCTQSSVFVELSLKSITWRTYEEYANPACFIDPPTAAARPAVEPPRAQRQTLNGQNGRRACHCQRAAACGCANKPCRPGRSPPDRPPLSIACLSSHPFSVGVRADHA